MTHLQRLALSVFLPLLVLTPSAQATLTIDWSAEPLSATAHDSYWLKLLHWTGSFDSGKSRLDGEGFFFSEAKGRTPETELRATLLAFFKPELQVGKLKVSPTCAFPERARFLKEKLPSNLTQWPTPPCERLDEFKTKFNADSATLVFSSAFPNNPGSAFGHTFLRINSKTVGDQAKLDLLDFGISYAAAVADDENPFAFMAFGVAGGYQGQFAMLPYYAKVGEYINSESRDVWEYNLNLTPEQTHRMLLHVWEIETNSHFNYFFFDENCAYHLLVLLEIAQPEWRLSDFSIYVIPGETVKRIVNTPGAVRSIRYRPSLRKKLIERYSLLTPEEQSEVARTLSGELSPQQVQSTATLDAAAARLFYDKQKNSQKLEEKDEKLLTAIRIERAKRGKSTDARPEPQTILEINPADPRHFGSRPEVAHHPYRLGVSSGLMTPESESTRFFTELQFKFAYHDLLNSDVGMVPFSQIDFPGIVLRYQPSPQVLRVERAPLVVVRSLFPLSDIEKRPSWGFAFGIETPRDFCDQCTTARLDAQGGYSVSMFPKQLGGHWLIAAHGTALVEAFSRIGFRAGPGVELMTMMQLIEQLKIQGAFEIKSDLFQSSRARTWRVAKATAALALSQSWDVRLGWQKLSSPATRWDESKLTLNYYF
jgi:hypothetical protein